MLKAFLQGKPFGHPLHPALVHFPIGFFILSLLLDMASYVWGYSTELFRASFYAMRNKLLGAGLISIKNKEYRLSGQFSKDLLDMARWWWTAILNNPEENL